MIRAGIVGVGYWGPNLLRNLSDNPEISVRWMCDLSSDTLKKLMPRYPSVPTTTRYADLLSDHSLDLIVVATPVQSHFDLVCQALNAGKHVLVTKPMAITEADCRIMIDLAEKRRRVLMVDHTFAYHPAVAHLKSMVQKNELGDLLYFQSSRMNLGLYQSDVSVIYDLMPHDLSILSELVNEDPVEISVSAKCAAKLPQADIAFMNLNFESHFIASVQASWLSPSKVRQVTLTGTKKMVVYDDMDVVQKVKVFDKGIETLANTSREESYTRFIQYRQGDMLAPAIPNTEALKIEIEHLVHCIYNDQVPRTSGYQGLRVVRLLEKADELAKSNRCWAPLNIRKSPSTSYRLTVDSLPSA